MQKNTGLLKSLWQPGCPHVVIFRCGSLSFPHSESTTTRTAGVLDFTAIGGKRQGREVPQSLRVKPGAKHPVWKTQSSEFGFFIE
ncbi:MAG: hypothetical protein PVI82_16045 [Desulfobacterales bacterium]